MAPCAHPLYLDQEQHWCHRGNTSWRGAPTGAQPATRGGGNVPFSICSRAVLAKPLARARHHVQGLLWPEGAVGTLVSPFILGVFSMPINTLLLPWPRQGAGPRWLPDSGLVIPKIPLWASPQDAGALLEPPHPDSTTGCPMWLPGSHTLSNPHPNLQFSSFHRFVLSLWEPDASHLFQCQMKLNICSFQGLWLAINKLANKDLVCWGAGGGSVWVAGGWVCVRVGCREACRPLCTFFFNQTFNFRMAFHTRTARRALNSG